MEDERIIELYMRRDEAAVRRTAEKYGRRLRTLSMGIVGDWQTAEECENDAYLEAWNSIPPHEPKGYFYAFLELSAELEQCIPSPDDMECRIDRLVLRQALNGFLGTLSAEKRAVFLRRYWYLDPVAGIAKRYGLSQSKVKTMLFRMRTQLRDYFEREGYDL